MTSVKEKTERIIKIITSLTILMMVSCNISFADYTEYQNGWDINGNSNEIIENNDTVFVDGDLTIGGNSSIEVNGLLIVDGDFTNEGSAITNNDGTIVVTGTTDKNGNAGSIDNDGDFYAGNDNLDQELKSTDQLPDDNQELSNYVESKTNTTLPITLLNFQGKHNNHMNTIKWTTIDETNFSHFVVQKSHDGEHFQSIGTVNGKGGPGERTQYSFNDYNNNGMAYYRLKAVDYDETSEFHGVISISDDVSKTEIVNASPDNGITINASDEGKMVVYDMNGNKKGNFSLQTGSNNIPVNDIQNTASGIYIVKIKAGQKVITERVML